MTAAEEHRLDGLEPDNLLAFMALLGLLRVLEESRPEWFPRVSWTVEEPPLRPRVQVREAVDEPGVVEAVAEGLDALVEKYDFGDLKNLKLSPEEARHHLQRAAEAVDRNPYGSDLWAALVSDAAVRRDGKTAEPSPLCLMFGQGHQYFLERLASVPREKRPPDRGKGRGKLAISETESLREALFVPWRRPDATKSFRWDPHENVRYALRARAPTDDRETTQHGANRLAAIGFSTLTAVPGRRFGQVRLAVLGGAPETGGTFVFRWPIWRPFASLAAIRCLLGHPRLDDRDALAVHGVVEIRRLRRIGTGKFMNFTRGQLDAGQ